MNTAQLTSLVKQAANAAAGYLTVHGAIQSASIINSQDTIGILVLLTVWIYSHFFQHTDTQEATPTPLPASKGNNILSLLLLCAASGLIFAGCGVDFATNVFNSERLLTDGAKQATHSFNLYASFATNGASPADIAKVNETQQQLYAADKDLAHGLIVVDNLRLAYSTNASTTNKAAITLALQVLANQSSNVTAITKSIIPAQVAK